MNKEEILQGLQSLEQRIMEFEKKIPAFEKTITALDQDFKNVESEWKNDDSEYREQIRKIEEQRQLRAAQYYESRNEFMKDRDETLALLNQVKNEVQSAVGEKAQLLTKLSELEQVEGLIQSVQDKFENSLWGQALKDFQKDDVLAGYRAFKDELNGVLNANVMGAGKTLETAALFDLIIGDLQEELGRPIRVLWVTKKSLRKSTQKEIMKWLPDQKVLFLEGQAQQRSMMLQMALMMNPIPWVVINYEQLNTMPELTEIDWDLIAMDEVHRLKGGSAPTPTQVFENTMRLLWDKSEDTFAGSKHHNPRVWRQRYRYFAPLSGSPVQNHPREMWPYLHAFKPDRFPAVSMFEKRYCKDVWDAELGQHVPRANLEELLAVLKGQVIRQDPEIIWASRPDKEHVDYFLDFSPKQEEVYKNIRDNLFLQLENMEGQGAAMSIASILPMLTYLRQANVWPDNIKVKNKDGSEYHVNCGESAKIDQAMEILDEIFADGEQAVVWSSQFTGPLDELKKRLTEQHPEKRVEILDGRCSSEQSEEFESAFQQGQIAVLLCNRKSVSEGFNLQKNPKYWPGGARHAIFLDLWWTPEGNKQAEDRIWREGADQGVVIHRLFIDGSVDELMQVKNAIKEVMTSELMDGGSLRPAEWAAVLKDLL